MFDWRAGLMAGATVVCVAGAAVPRAQPRQIGGVGITVYADINYRGENATFRSDEPDLGRAGFGGRISSLHVAAGEMWEGCVGVNYQPPCQVFSGAEPDLRRRNWNDRIGSLRRVRNGGGGGGGGNRGLVLYSDERFGGQSRAVNGPTPSLGSYNDKARSLRVYGGTWDVCEDIDYGKCRTVDRDLSSLAGLGLSKRVSSVRPAVNGRGGRGDRPPQARPVEGS